MAERNHLEAKADVRGSMAIAQSFEDFFEVEHDGLMGALYLVTGDRHEAEEAMQEAFVRVWERWEVVQSFSNPTGYLYRTVINVWRMRQRRLRVAARRLTRAPNASDAFEEVELREDVRQALASLPARKRAALVLTDLLGYPASEAASALRVRPSTIRSLTTQARASLRVTLGEDR